MSEGGAGDGREFEPFFARAPERSAAGAPASLAALGQTLGHMLTGTRLRDYEITGLIGEGGFGIVYLAWDHSLQRKVAIKEYMPASMVSRIAGSSAIVVKSDRHLDTFKAGLKSFVNEARLLARFDHPSLVKVYRFWEENGTAYMVMPFYEGPTLKTALAELGHVPSEAELRAWLDPLLDALTVMHAAQCFHRDIAPDNILLTASGPLLLDFGAARRVIGDMTHALTVVLKPGYAPIEQYGDVASMSQGAWTDLYALACVVYYAITGKTPMSSVERLMDDRIEPLSVAAAGRYSAAFLGAIDAALAVRPQDRPQDEARFRALLDADRPATPKIVARPSPPVSHEPFPGTELHTYRTVPGTLMPVLATELHVRAPAPTTPDASRRASVEARHSQPAAFAASGPASLAPTEDDSVLRSLDDAAASTLTPGMVAVAPRAPRRMPLLLVAVIVVALGLGVAVLWVLRSQGAGGELPPRDAVSAPAIAAPLASSAKPPATTSTSPSAPPRPSTEAVAASAASPQASVVVGPGVAVGPGVLLPSRSPTTAAEAVPPSRLVPSMAAPSSALPAMVETPAAPARDATTTSTRTPTTYAARTRRDTTSSPPQVDASPEPRAEPPRRAAAGARCSDILQKASLEPLTAEEAAYLKRECR